MLLIVKEMLSNERLSLTLHKKIVQDSFQIEFCTQVVKQLVRKYPFMRDVWTNVTGFSMNYIITVRLLNNMYDTVVGYIILHVANNMLTSPQTSRHIGRV